MKQLVPQARLLGPRSRPLPYCQPSLAWPRRSTDLRSAAEDMLRDIAFVYQATQCIREAIIGVPAGERRMMPQGSVAASSRRVCVA
jgi:hypothetical protein